MSSSHTLPVAELDSLTVCRVGRALCQTALILPKGAIMNEWEVFPKWLVAVLVMLVLMSIAGLIFWVPAGPPL